MTHLLICGLLALAGWGVTTDGYALTRSGKTNRDLSAMLTVSGRQVSTLAIGCQTKLHVTSIPTNRTMKNGIKLDILFLPF